MNRRVDANLDALERPALDPLDHPFANLRNDQGWPHPLQRGCRHRRSRETERQARLLGIVDAAGSGDSNLAIADVGLGQQHAVLFGVEAQANGDAIEDQRWFAIGSCEHDGAATETHLPIGNIVVGWLKMGQQRDPVLTGNDLEGRQQHAPAGIPFDAHLRRIDRHRIIWRIAVDEISGAGGNLAAEIGRQAVAAEFTLQFAGQQEIRAIGQVLHSQRQQDIRGRDLVGANIHRPHAVRGRSDRDAQRPCMAALFADAERHPAAARPPEAEGDVLEIPFVAALLIVDGQDSVLQTNFIEVLAIKAGQAQAVEPVEAGKQSGWRVGNWCGRAGFCGRR